MITILSGQDQNLIQYKLESLIKPSLLSDCEIHLFSGDIGEIIEKINQNSLFNSKIIVVRNCTFIEDQLEEFQNKIQNFDKTVFLLIETKKVIKPNKFFCSVLVKSFSRSEKEKLVDKIMADKGVSFDCFVTKNFFLEKVYDNPYFVENETQKLINFSQSPEIDLQMVEQCTFMHEDSNIFKIISFYLSNKKLECLSLFESLISKKYQPVEILQIISTQIYNLWIFQTCLVNKMSSTEIEASIKMGKYQQRMNFPLLKSKISLDRFINEIYLLDYNIKHGSINSYIGLKTLLMK